MKNRVLVEMIICGCCIPLFVEGSSVVDDEPSIHDLCNRTPGARPRKSPRTNKYRYLIDDEQVGRAKSKKHDDDPSSITIVPKVSAVALSGHKKQAQDEVGHL